MVRLKLVSRKPGGDECMIGESTWLPKGPPAKVAKEAKQVGVRVRFAVRHLLIRVKQ